MELHTNTDIDNAIAIFLLDIPAENHAVKVSKDAFSLVVEYCNTAFQTTMILSKKQRFEKVHMCVSENALFRELFRKAGESSETVREPRRGLPDPTRSRDWYLTIIIIILLLLLYYIILYY